MGNFLKKRVRETRTRASEISDWFQEGASRIAAEQNLPKVHLDVFYWRKGK